MSRQHTFPLHEVLVCIVIAAMAGILSDNASPIIPVPDEFIMRVVGKDRDMLQRDRRSANRYVERMHNLGYDTLIARNCLPSGMDWRLIASVIFQESGLIAQDSATGQKYHGLMQISPEAAHIFGMDEEDLRSPDRNIEAGSRYLRHLMDIFTKEGIDSANAVKYALASYNCGIGRIQKIRDSASAQGINTDRWEDFEGLFDNSEGPTRKYVSEITNRYENLKKYVK